MKKCFIKKYRSTCAFLLAQHLRGYFLYVRVRISFIHPYIIYAFRHNQFMVPKTSKEYLFCRMFHRSLLCFWRMSFCEWWFIKKRRCWKNNTVFKFFPCCCGYNIVTCDLTHLNVSLSWLGKWNTFWYAFILPGYMDFDIKCRIFHICRGSHCDCIYEYYWKVRVNLGAQASFT